jgi:hypothetical protein
MVAGGAAGAPSLVEVSVGPRGSLELLSQLEVARLREGSPRLLDLLRRCALAVLSTGEQQDDALRVFERYRDFDIEVLARTRGVRLRLRNAPAAAFVDLQMITGVKEHLFAVVRDLVYLETEVFAPGRFDLSVPREVTDAVFHVLRNAGTIAGNRRASLVVCWGGHAISRAEYEYTKEVGYHLGLRGLDICTGCGMGAMKGPMKGAAIGHAKQRVADGRYLGITEPGIIAAEPPNPMVNQLVIMPDIEKRLEAFMRLGHAFVVFPGGVGTAEEVLYLLGVLLHPDNAGRDLRVVLTGPAASAGYFEALDDLIAATIGPAARRHYEIVIGDAAAAAQAVQADVRRTARDRRHTGDAMYFNWLLNIPPEFQRPFHVDHAAMRALPLHRDQPPWQLAAALRRAFSGIVTGNVKEVGRRLIDAHGPFELTGDAGVVAALDRLLRRFVAERRMKLADEAYDPCYRLAGVA